MYTLCFTQNKCAAKQPITAHKESAVSSKTFTESLEEMEHILREETVGYLGLSMNGMPYVVPLNYGYIEGKIIFHCAQTGKKLDYLKHNAQVCFTVGQQSGAVRRHPQGALCHIDEDSVICYGIARIVEDENERHALLNTFNQCLQPGADAITRETAAKCGAVEITITEMTGRRERDRKRTYWRYVFETEANT
jgi:nitroimidazol reductase NimA-like FMN-containing flavoprotein (pyridoxamine 5'-phosphate oxidase superfamily)